VDQFLERIYWRRQMVHEAGHAVASLVLLDLSADIVAMNYLDPDGVLQKHARFKFDPGIQIATRDFPAPALEEQNLLEKAKIIGAGGIAETLYFGGPPRGATGDMRKLNRIMGVLAVMSPTLRALLAEEVDRNFPETRRLLKNHLPAITRIWKKAFYEFKRRRLAGKKEFKETPVLYELQVRRLFLGKR